VISYIDYDVMRGNNEGEPLLVEMTIVGSTLLYLKMLRPRIVLYPRKIITSQNGGWGPPQKSMRVWA
jgi:hypothetical protein